LWELVEDRPVPRLPPYRSDATAPVDELTRIGDAVALAELITARTVRPPLAVGLFGDWGEGKSHFLGLLQHHVTMTARPDNPLAHAAVRQVRFNAWHYAETDLWASLVAELFAQLAASPDADLGSEQRRQSRLAAELVAERGLPQRLRAARLRRDQLRQALREPAGPWAGLTPDQQARMRALAGDHPDQVYQQAAYAVAALRETGRGSWRIICGVPATTVARFLILITLLVAAAIAVGWGLPQLWRWAAALPGLATLLAAGGLAARFASATRARANAAWQAAIRIGTQQRERLQTAAAVAAAEVTALEREMQNLTAAGQLAGLVVDRTTGAGYRTRLGLMTQIREDFTRMADLLAASHDNLGPGVSTRSASPGAPPDDRRTQEGPAPYRDRLADGGAAPIDIDAVGDELPRIDRIVIYIDDLDRCPPRRVVEMLEAIHLLLAVDLFVVVVAVDPRWLLRAIAAHYRDLLDTPPAAAAQEASGVDPDDEELWRSTPAQYLEKIFQVVLTLPPLDTTGYQRLLRTLVGTPADQPAPPPETHNLSPNPNVTSADTPTADTADTPPADENEDEAEAEMFGVRLPAARIVERVDPLTLDPDELALLDLLGPPLLVATPRAVKRLANSYGLLTAMRREHRDADLAEQHISIREPITGQLREVTYRPYRAGVVLLAALVAYPALGPALFLHLHHSANNSHQTWSRHLDSLRPRSRDGRWHNAADPAMTPVQAQQWQALIDGLHDAGTTAAAHGLPLPEPITAWVPWVIPVGRMSFPTGRIVNTIDRQRPLDTAPAPNNGLRDGHIQ
jgi:hypothetical protein